MSIWVQITHCKFMDTNTLHKPPIHFKDMSWFNRCIVFCGVGFGSGLAPKAPGTFGSAFALLFVPIWLSLGFNLSLIAILIMSLVGIYICGQTAKVIDVHDDGRIVWDEFAGQSITFLPLLYLQQMNWMWVIGDLYYFGFSMFGNLGLYALLIVKCMVVLVLCLTILLPVYGLLFVH